VSTTLTLTIGTGVEGEGAALWGVGGAPATGLLPPGMVERIAGEVEAALAAPAGLLLAASDVDSAARERAAAEALGRLVAPPGMQAIRDALVAARSRSEALVLAVDARSDALRRLPWELLAGLPPGRSPLGVDAVVRLSTREPPAAPSPADRLDVRLWAPQADDLVVEAVVDGLRQRAEADPRIALVELPADLVGTPPRPDGPALLHVVSHGLAAISGVGLAGPGGVQAAETVTRALAPWADGCVLAIADVCEGAAASDDPADSPAWRLALAGLPVVVGPRTRWAMEASAAFREGLLAALLDGAALLPAVEAGRGRLRSLAVAHESCRWWTPLTIVATPLATRITAIRPPARIPGWPPCDPALAAVLHHAVDAARGYLGVEHLLAALAQTPDALPPALAMLQPALVAAAERCPPLPLSGDAAPTPRVQAMGTLLADGFDALALARSLAVVPWLAAALDPAARARILAPPGDDGRGTLPLEHDLPMPAPADILSFEVEGGPEDGRILTLSQPGDVLGRWDPGRPDDTRGRLYVGRSDADRTLSRRQLVVVQGYTVQLRAGSKLSRGGAPAQAVSGQLTLQPGDRLLLGASSRLRIA